MARRLATSVVVRESEPVHPDRPELGVNVTREETFLAGDTLPAWAQKAVGEHVPFEGDNDEEDDMSDQSDQSNLQDPRNAPPDPALDPKGAAKAADEAAKANAEKANAESGQVAEPAKTASVDEWKKFARSKGANDADLEGQSRNDLRDKYAN